MLSIIGPIHPGMIVMIRKAILYFDAMIVEQFFIATYIDILFYIIMEALSYRMITTW